MATSRAHVLCILLLIAVSNVFLVFSFKSQFQPSLFKLKSRQLINNEISTSTSSSSFISRSDKSTSLNLFEGFKKLVGATDSKEIASQDNEKQIKIYLKTVDQINALEKKYESVSNEELVGQTDTFKKRLQQGESLDSILPDAFAVAREASWRILQMRHFDVQLIGGLALHDGRLAEMATGEGKTLVALLPAYLNALTGNGVYVVTTNDYLAKRDGENIGQVLKFLGLSVGVIQAYQKEAERKQSYNCDVTYVANQELGFDFLRDNLAMTLDAVVQPKPYNFCIIDEADSILIDEAKTPLIISRKGSPPTQKYITSAQIAQNLKKDVHYEVNEKDQKIDLTNNGFKFVEQILNKNLFDLNDPWAFYIINAVKAKELFNLNRDYIIAADGTVSIVDTFSGRVLEGRRFTDGIQQSIEAKEKLKITSETQIVAKVTYQNLFRLFPKIAGMSGTAATEARELIEVYQLPVLKIPTALPIARRDNDDAVFKSKEGKMKAMLRNILTVHEKGRPILIGTTSVAYSEEVFSALQDLGISAQLLNAKPENVERESEIVAQAGRLGAVTVATNMAGRGTDIILGGSSKGIAKALARSMLLAKLGLVAISPVTATTVGEVVDGNMVEVEVVEEEVEVETDPDVLSLPSVQDVASHLQIDLPVRLRKQTELNLKRAVISCLDYIENKADKLVVEDVIAQATDSSPGASIDIRRLRSALKDVISEFDSILKAESDLVKKLGGLYVVGTSRHESRRIDLQLRGRCGRQGDPGGTRFFLSLEDDIFKIFGGDKLSGVMENFRVAEDMPIESDLVNQALDKIQTQVEDYFSGNRRQVLRLDEITSSQRSAVYTMRRAVLSSSDEGMMGTFEKYCTQTLKEIYDAALVTPSSGKGVSGGPVNAEKLVSKAIQFFPNMRLSTSEVESTPANKVPELLAERLKESLDQKKKLIDSATTWAFAGFFRYLTLVQTDESWCKHLSRLDLLKEEMVLQSFTAERDVMDTYRERAMKLFDSLLDEVRRNTVYSVMIYAPKV